MHLMGGVQCEIVPLLLFYVLILYSISHQVRDPMRYVSSYVPFFGTVLE